MNTEYIIIGEYIKHCNIEPQFIAQLEENGLIHVLEVENERSLPLDELANLERYTRMYYDLSINIEGIDIIDHLLKRILQLQDEMRILRSQLHVLE